MNKRFVSGCFWASAPELSSALARRLSHWMLDTECCARLGCMPVWRSRRLSHSPGARAIATATAFASTFISLVLRDSDSDSLLDSDQQALAAVPPPQSRSNKAAHHLTRHARLLDAGDVLRACSLPAALLQRVQLTCPRRRSPDPVSSSSSVSSSSPLRLASLLCPCFVCAASTRLPPRVFTLRVSI